MQFEIFMAIFRSVKNVSFIFLLIIGISFSLFSQIGKLQSLELKEDSLIRIAGTTKNKGKLERI